MGLRDSDFGSDDLPVNETTLAELIEDKGARATNYFHDFSDSSDHKIKIGKISDPTQGEFYPKLTEITRRCALEGLGEFPSYEEFLEVMAYPKHSEHADLKT